MFWTACTTMACINYSNSIHPFCAWFQCVRGLSCRLAPLLAPQMKQDVLDIASKELGFDRQPPRAFMDYAACRAIADILEHGQFQGPATEPSASLIYTGTAHSLANVHAQAQYVIGAVPKSGPITDMPRLALSVSMAYAIEKDINCRDLDVELETVYMSHSWWKVCTSQFVHFHSSTAPCCVTGSTSVWEAFSQ